MNNAYFTEQFDDKNNWQFTKITVPHKIMPFYQVLTGGENRRFIFTTPQHKLHWGVAEPYAHGVKVIRNPAKFSHEIMPIAPITSQDIENFKQISPTNAYQYWANFFAKALIQSPTTMLGQGNWKVFIKLPFKIFPKNYVEKDKYHHFNQSIQLFNDAIFTHLLWGMSAAADNLLVLKGLPYEESGRVKWWRKKIRENTCPPLLLWYQNHLQAYVLMDGHARLKAYQLEKVEPVMVIISQHFQQTIPIDSPERIRQRLSFFAAVKKNIARGNPIPTIETLNNTLIGLYQDISYDYLDLVAKPIATLDEIWLADIQQFKRDTTIDQNSLANMIAGEIDEDDERMW